MRGLRNKVAIVTGATKDMGGAVAARLSQEGVKVVCCGRDIAQGEEKADKIRRDGGDAVFLCADVSVEEDVQSVVGKAVAQFGRLDIVVNLAAATDLGRSGGLKRVTEDTEEGFNSQFAVNLMGPFWFYKFAIPEMEKNGGGVFVNISTLSATRASPGLGSYSVSKAALEALSRQVAVDYADSNIRSNCIGIGAIRITQSAPLHDHPEAGPALRSSQMLQRAGDPEDVASMVAFLASDESSFASGEVFPLDGGALVKMPLPDLKAIYGKR